MLSQSQRHYDWMSCDSTAHDQRRRNGDQWHVARLTVLPPSDILTQTDELRMMASV